MIHFVIGTRAQIFKMAPIMLECEKRGLEWRWVYTAQHRETMSQTLETFGLPEPDYTVINWDDEAKSISKMSKWFGKMMLSVFSSRKILDYKTGKHSIVLTHGDTFTTWFAALYGRFTFTKVMHIEAGLRSGQLFQPFPEELNRRLVGMLSNYHMCENDDAVANLKWHKLAKIVNTHHNTQIDTIEFGMDNAHRSKLKLPKEKYVVATIHRYENIFDKKRFENIIQEIEKIAEKFKVQYVLHPATELQLKKLNFFDRMKNNPNIDLLPRLEYLDFIKLIKDSEFVISDGGGNQQELYYIGKPTILFRDVTERPRELGKTVALSKMDPKIIDDFVANYKSWQGKRIKPKKRPTDIIVDELANFEHNTH